MPNVKKRFADDDPSSDDDNQDDEDVQVAFRGGGKGMRIHGGKGMGKQLRPPPGSSDEDDDDSDEDDQPASYGGGGKQLRPAGGGGKQLRAHVGGGKQLRAPDDDDDDDDSEDEAPVTRPVQRGGGKSLIRMQAPDESEEESSEEEPVRPVQRGGGKSLASMTPPQARGGKQLRLPQQDDDDDDEDSEEEEAAPSRPQVVQRTGGKSLARMQAASKDDDDDDDDDDNNGSKDEAPVPVRQTGGKQLRSGGKQLRRPSVKEDSESEDDGEDEAMDLSDDDDEEEEPQPVKKKAPPKKAPVKRQPTRRAATKKPEPDDMEESDDDDESSDEEAELDFETFDPSKLVKDEEDQKYLDSLPELEREAILGERFEKRKAEQDMKMALRDAKRKKREEKAAMDKKAGKKRKAAPAKKGAKKKSKDDTSGDASLAEALSEKRESGRNKDAKGTKATKAKALAALREERKRSIRKEESSESESDFGDDDEDSDDDYDEGPALKPWQKKAAAAAKSNVSRLDQALDSDEEDEEMEDATDSVPKRQAVFVEADLEGYQKITLPRRRLARWCNEPFFEDAVINYYVKLFVGENEAGKRCYRLCKIVDIKSEGATYLLPAVRNEKAISTDKMLVLQFGKNERTFPIKLISDVKVTEEDITQYITAMKAVRMDTISKREANVLRRKQDNLVNNYTYTKEDIERNIQERKKKGATSASNISSEQMRAAIATKAARNALEEAKREQVETLKTDDQKRIAQAEEKVLRLRGQLEEREEEERMLVERANSRKQKLAERAKDKKWAKVNLRSVQMNQQADFGAYKNQDRVEETTADGKPKFNPYARRKVKPKILWEVGQNEEKEGEEKASDGRKDAEKGKASEENIAPTLVQEQQEKAAALSQSHQFSIDEEVLALSSYTKGIAGLSENKKQVKRTRKGLSLLDYQEQKAAGTL